MDVAVVRYNAGNICSVMHALRRIGANPILTDNAEALHNAPAVVFPGQGEAATTMAFLRESGLADVLKGLSNPVLGICIGEQLLTAHSEEGDTTCLGVFPEAEVRRFRPASANDKIPHMGWNALTDLRSPLFDGVPEGSYVYFVHSYYIPLGACTIARTDYCQPFSAAIARDNFFATQFHPEKSGLVGERILRNFLNQAEQWK